MKFLAYIRTALSQTQIPRKTSILLLLAFFASAFYPAIDPSYRPRGADTNMQPLAQGVEDYGRFINTALQIATPLILRDANGLVQLAAIAVTATFTTHAAKRLMNDWTINGVRLGQRPSGENSQYNMPSGHSSMAASAVYFLARRYSYWFLLVTLPVLFLTMFSRVALEAHTAPAVFAGAFLGLLTAALFTTRRSPQKTDTQQLGNPHRNRFSLTRRRSSGLRWRIQLEYQGLQIEGRARPPRHRLVFDAQFDWGARRNR